MPREIIPEQGGAMYLRVTRGRLDPAGFDEVTQVGQEIAAASRRLPGNQSYVAGIDRASGRVLTVSTWDTEATRGRTASAAPTSHPGCRPSAYTWTHPCSSK